jgi:O-antigen/teichoic acid export membrane protein
MLFPAFSKLDPNKDKALFQNIFRFSVRYASFVVVPVTAMVITLAKPAIDTIFGNSYAEAPLFLALLSISYLYTALGNLSAGNLIIGQGFTNFNLKMTILTVIVGFPTSFILISTFGVIGLIVTTLTVGLPSLFLSLRFIKSHFGVSMDWISSGKILLSSAVASIATYAALSQLAFSNLINLLIGAIVFIIVLILVAIITRTVNETDIINLREISNGLGVLRKPLHMVISILEKLMKIFFSR